MSTFETLAEIENRYQYIPDSVWDHIRHREAEARRLSALPLLDRLRDMIAAQSAETARCRENFAYFLAEYRRTRSGIAMNRTPVYRVTLNTYRKLWIEERVKLRELEEQLARLLDQPVRMAAE